jgi:hypothetical protein
MPRKIDLLQNPMTASLGPKWRQDYVHSIPCNKQGQSHPQWNGYRPTNRRWRWSLRKVYPCYNIRFMIHESLVREDDPGPSLSLVCFSIWWLYCAVGPRYVFTAAIHSVHNLPYQIHTHMLTRITPHIIFLQKGDTERVYNDSDAAWHYW